jgi:hypothetical protein
MKIIPDIKMINEKQIKFIFFLINIYDHIALPGKISGKR